MSLLKCIPGKNEMGHVWRDNQPDARCQCGEFVYGGEGGAERFDGRGH